MLWQGADYCVCHLPSKSLGNHSPAIGNEKILKKLLAKQILERRAGKSRPLFLIQLLLQQFMP